VQVSTSSSFTAITDESDGVTGTSYTTAALADGTYYWRVRCIKTYGTFKIYGSWSSVRRFIIDTVSPNVPELISPVNGAVTAGVPAFSWSSISDAVAYRFAYSLTDDVDAHIYLSDEITGTTYTPTVKNMNVTYYWFVQAQDNAGNWSDWSDSNFVTILANTPAKVVLASPASRYLTADNTPEFTWTLLENCEYYDLQIANSSAFTTVVQEEDGITGTSYTASEIASDGVYYWRVRGRNGSSNYGAWSAARSFTLDTTAPDVPSAISPSDGSSVTVSLRSNGRVLPVRNTIGSAMPTQTTRVRSSIPR
jgi:hypothetical protein